MKATAALVVGATLQCMSGPVAAQAPASGNADALDEWIAARLDEHDVPAVAIAVVDRNRIVKTAGYGLANVELQAEASELTMFQTASVGKQFTAAAILLLAEDGRLALDDPIDEYLDEAPEAWRLVSIRNLLNHTSGIPDYNSPSWNLRRDYTEAELLEEFARFPLRFPPGTEWSYSNTGYAILGILISRITGAHWSEFVRERVFAPAGMRTARLMSEADIVPNRADGYRVADGELKNQQWVSPSVNSTGDGALYVSAVDMAHWAVALSDDSVLSNASREAMWTRTRLHDGLEVSYGFGWALDDVLGRPAVHHTGNWQGFVARYTRFTDDDLSVAVFANSTRGFGLLDAITEQVLLRYRPDIEIEREAAPAPIRVDRQALGAYVGDYWMSDGAALRFSLAEGGLVVSGAGGSGLSARPYAPDAFVFERSSLRLIFVRDPESGSVTGFHNPSGTLRGRKIR